MGGVAEPRVPLTLAEGVLPSSLAEGLSPAFPAIFAVIPGKSSLLGERLYPFAGLEIIIPAGLAAARWRRGSLSAFIPIAVADFTDLLSAIRFTSEVTNNYGTFLYQLELTDTHGGSAIFNIHISTKISVISGKSTEVDKPFRPFSEAVIAADPSQISSVQYLVEGDINVPLRTISRTIFYSGTHSGADANPDLVSEQNLVDLGIRLTKDVVKNVTDGSEGVITAIVGGVLTAVLVGGVRNNWNAADTYEIVDGDNMVERALRFEHVPDTIGIARYILVVADLAGNNSSAVVISRIF